MQTLNPLYLEKEYNSRHCQKIILFYLLNSFLEENLTLIQTFFLRDFDQIKSDFFCKWDEFSTSLKDTYEIAFFLLLTVMHEKTNEECNFESNLSKYEIFF